MSYYNPQLEKEDLYERLYQLDEDIDNYIDENNLRVKNIDVVIAKIYANRGKDLDHLKNPNLINQINWSSLKECALEMHDSLLTDNQYHWFVSRYNDFVEVNQYEEIVINDLQHI